MRLPATLEYPIHFSSRPPERHGLSFELCPKALRRISAPGVLICQRLDAFLLRGPWMPPSASMAISLVSEAKSFHGQQLFSAGSPSTPSATPIVVSGPGLFFKRSRCGAMSCISTPQFALRAPVRRRFYPAKALSPVRPSGDPSWQDTAARSRCLRDRRTVYERASLLAPSLPALRRKSEQRSLSYALRQSAPPLRSPPSLARGRAFCRSRTHTQSLRKRRTSRRVARGSSYALRLSGGEADTLVLY